MARLHVAKSSKGKKGQQKKDKRTKGIGSITCKTLERAVPLLIDWFSSVTSGRRGHSSGHCGHSSGHRGHFTVERARQRLESRDSRHELLLCLSNGLGSGLVPHTAPWPPPRAYENAHVEPVQVCQLTSQLLAQPRILPV